MEPRQFTALCAGFDAAANDPDAPIDPSLLAQVRSALAEAKATALPGLPILITLQSADELTALAACSRLVAKGMLTLPTISRGLRLGVTRAGGSNEAIPFGLNKPTGEDPAVAYGIAAYRTAEGCAGAAMVDRAAIFGELTKRDTVRREAKLPLLDIRSGVSSCGRSRHLAGSVRRKCRRYG